MFARSPKMRWWSILVSWMRDFVLQMWKCQRAYSRCALATVAVLLAASGCRGTKEVVAPPPPPPVVPASVTISDRGDTLSQLVPVTLSATIRGTNGQVLTTPAVRWASLNDRIGTIDSSGVFTPKKPGVVSITATAGSVADTTQLTVGMRWLSIVTSRSWGACGIGGDSTAYCWGTHFVSGRREEPPPSRPKEIPGNLRFASIVMGVSFACGMTANRQVYCWGVNDKRQFGAFTPDTSSLPVRVPLTLTLIQLVAGSFHLCGLATDADVYCWGDNTYGQLGDGGTAISGIVTDPTPKKIPGLPRIRSINAAWFHQCALSETGQAYCWGDNRTGNAGGGTLSPTAKPTAVVGNLVFRELGDRWDGSCGIAVGGSAYCWGNIAFPLTGPTSVPQLEVGTTAYTQIAGSAWVLCGLTPNGMQCRGNNGQGTLGMGNVGSAATPQPVTGGGDFVKMSLGAAASCAINKASKAFCWGQAADGQLGDGLPFGIRLVPTPVLDPVTP